MAALMSQNLRVSLVFTYLLVMSLNMTVFQSLYKHPFS